jgi:hypothetical protein
MFTLGTFLKITKEAQHFRRLPWKMYSINFGKTTPDWAIFWAIFNKPIWSPAQL